jgi:hypothetical protein
MPLIRLKIVHHLNGHPNVAKTQGHKSFNSFDAPDWIFLSGNSNTVSRDACRSQSESAVQGRVESGFMQVKGSELIDCLFGGDEAVPQELGLLLAKGA